MHQFYIVKFRVLFEKRTSINDVISNTIGRCAQIKWIFWITRTQCLNIGVVYIYINQVLRLEFYMEVVILVI